MIKVTILTTKGCSHCMQAKEILSKLKPKYDLNIEDIDVTTDRGQELAKKHKIMTSPGILINDEFFSMGGVTEGQLRSKFDELA
ncbi:MAG: glutaredoxin [Candidatus Babeliales bacterium]